MKTEIVISGKIAGPFDNFFAACEVPALMYEAFEPMKSTDEPLLAFALGEHLAGSKTMHGVIKIREDAARILAEELATMLVAAMASRDLKNGYKK